MCRTFCFYPTWTWISFQGSKLYVLITLQKITGQNYLLIYSTLNSVYSFSLLFAWMVAIDHSESHVCWDKKRKSPARFIWNLIGTEHWIPTAGINWIMLLFIIKSSFLIGKSCPALYSPINGSIVSQSCGALFGSQATFACNKGHRLSGSRVRSCQEDGAWSGRNTSCSGKIKRKRQGHPTTVFCKISIRERK